METDVLPQTTSPIISQYEAQLHRDSAYDPLASFPASDHFIHTRSVHVSSNHNNTCVHTSPDHNVDSRQVSHVFNHTPPVSQMITHPNDATDDYDEPPRTPVSVQPPWDELNSVVYDKSDHPNSPEINHILYHGVRIYDAINPDPPIFDSSIPCSRLLLSPQPKTMLTSPTKRNDSLSGFAVHATTVNAFTATASSNSPPSLALKVICSLLAIYCFTTPSEILEANMFTFSGTKHLWSCRPNGDKRCGEPRSIFGREPPC